MSHAEISLSNIPSYFSEQDLDIKRFEVVCSETTNPADYPCATDVQHNIPIYDGDTLRGMLDNPDEEAKIKAELCRCLRNGPGIFVIKNAYPDKTVVDRATKIFQDIVEEEKASGLAQGDHFGSNERIWNSLQKLCVRDPELCIEYYGNSMLALACRAWLGPNYQVTAQLNNVKPGSKAQDSHRDYHLGFQSKEVVAKYPAHAQIISQYLTLQGAIAHVDMPLESGPTLFLPFSQKFDAGYMTYRMEEFVNYFHENKVQLPFEKGDMAFFSPALFHGAGSNVSENDRLANLVQISSSFGRTMETLNHNVMAEAVYPALKKRVEAGTISQRHVQDAIASVADGYSFPTNLDSDAPIGGNAPETSQQLLIRALEDGWDVGELKEKLSAYAKRREA